MTVRPRRSDGGTRARSGLALTAAHVALSRTVVAQAAPAEAQVRFVGESCFAIQVEDIAAGAEWYGSVLGLTEVKRLESDEGRIAIRLLARRGLAVDLIWLPEIEPDVQRRRFGLFEAGFFVDDIDRALE